MWNTLKRSLNAFARDESGATVIEYGLIAALIFIGIIAVLQEVGIELAAVFTDVSAGFQDV